MIPKTSIAAIVIAVSSAALRLSDISGDPGWAAVFAMTAVVAALILSGFGIAQRPKDPLTLGAGTLTALIALAGVHPKWDAYLLLCEVAAGVSAVAAVVVMLPSFWQRLVVSGLVVFHFLGIFSAITSPPPQAWLSSWAWVKFFRPHLVFCYTNNAYQFYSPEPGPACLLWFCVEMNDGSRQWFKMPQKPDSHLDPMAVEFYRRLSITESTNQLLVMPGPPPTFEQRRRSVTHIIPLHRSLALAGQFRMPQDFSRRNTSAYARFVAQSYGGRDKVKAVKVYRVTHEMLRPRQFAEGDDPFAPWLYYPFYSGEYDAEGELTQPDDPLLYWLIPIMRRSSLVGEGMPGRGKVEIENYLAVHAGSDPFAEN